MTCRISTIKNSKHFSHLSNKLHTGRGRFSDLQIPIFGKEVYKLQGKVGEYLLAQIEKG